MRKGVVVVVLVAVFLTVGLPRFLDGDVPLGGADPDARFVKVCREHGGTPATTGGTGAEHRAERRCTVRYGGRVYLMDAITPEGFDEDTARFQQQGCDEARRQQRASSDPAERRRTFVYHADTGVCERRP